MFRHLASKVRNKNAVDSVSHAGFFEAVVLPFVGRNLLLLCLHINTVALLSILRFGVTVNYVN